MSDDLETTTDCAGQLKALAEATRLAVVEMLMSGPRHVGEIGAALQIDQSLLSHHLRVLRDAGLVEATRDGRSVLYGLAPRVSGTERQEVDLGCCVLSFPSRSTD